MDPMTMMQIAKMLKPAVGGLMAKFGQSNPASTTQIPRFNEQQMGAQNQFLAQALQGLGGGGGMENEARRGFEQKTMPSIAERFAGMDALTSSGYRNSMAEAGSNLDSSLAGLNQGNLMNLLQLGMQPQNEQFYQQESPSMMQQMAPFMMSGMGDSSGDSNNRFMEFMKNLFSNSNSGDTAGGSGDIGQQGQMPELSTNSFQFQNNPVTSMMNTMGNPSTYGKGFSQNTQPFGLSPNSPMMNVMNTLSNPSNILRKG